MYVVYLRRPLAMVESSPMMHEMPGSVHIFAKYSHLPVSAAAIIRLMDAAPGNTDRHEHGPRKAVCWTMYPFESRAAPSVCMDSESPETAARNYARCHKQEGKFRGRCIGLAEPKHACHAPEERTGQHCVPARYE